MAALVDAHVTAALIGGCLGALAGFVPGLHVNTLATLGLALALDGRLEGTLVVPGALAALGAWTVTNVVPLVVLGVPEGEHAPALLPGQRLAREGRARGALSASLQGSVLGLAVAAALSTWLLHGLGDLEQAGHLGQAVPWVAGIALAVLVLTDPAGPARASLVVAVAGLLGIQALGLPVSSPVGLPGSVLLPLFLGLFGLPALRMAARAGSPPSSQAGEDEDARSPGVAGPVLGAGLGLLAGVFPGFTTGPATAVAAQLSRGGDEKLLATTSAVNTAGAVVATAALHAIGRTRTGVHVAHAALGAPAGTPQALLGDLSTLSLGVLVGAAVLWASLPLARQIGEQVPRVAAGLVPIWLVLVVAFTGWPGLLVAAAGWSVAALAAHLGTRRSVLMASLLVPTLARAVGV